MWVIASSPSLGDFISKERLISILPDDTSIKRGFNSYDEARDYLENKNEMIKKKVIESKLVKSFQTEKQLEQVK